MTVRVLFFSQLRDLCGLDEVECELDSEASAVENLLEKLYLTYEGLREWDGRLLVAVNHDYADRTTSLNSGDEIAVMPPVQGG
jgi:molybdopterin synthase sulfur carrier subunit